MLYWDASALVKLYVPEPDSPLFFDLARRNPDPIVVSAIISAEVLCAFHRKEQTGGLGPGGAVAAYREFLADLAGGVLITVPLGPDVLAETETVVRAVVDGPRPGWIRALDAIHVGSALAVRAHAVVATDARLRDAASAVGLKVLP